MNAPSLAPTSILIRRRTQSLQSRDCRQNQAQFSRVFPTPCYHQPQLSEPFPLLYFFLPYSCFLSVAGICGFGAFIRDTHWFARYSRVK